MPRRRCFMEMELTFNIGRAEKLIRYFAHPEKRGFQHLRLTDNTESVFVSEHRPRHVRISSQTRSYLLPDATESAPRRDRIWEQKRLHTLPRSPTSIGTAVNPLNYSSIAARLWGLWILLHQFQILFFTYNIMRHVGNNLYICKI